MGTAVQQSDKRQKLEKISQSKPVVKTRRMADRSDTGYWGRACC
jgi:hypothetical protein